MASRPHIQHTFERSSVGGGDKVLGPLQGLRFVDFMIHNYFIDQSLKSENISAILYKITRIVSFES